MKTMRFYTLLVLLLIAGGVTMQAQEAAPSAKQMSMFEAKKATETEPMQQPSIVSVATEWLHYGSDVYGSNLAYIPEGIPFSWAVSFPPERLQSYDGFTMTQVALYENEWNIGDLKLQVCYGNAYMPLTVMDEQIVTPENLVGLVEIQLLRPVEIDVSQHLWIVFSELDVTETYSAAICYDDNADPNARWVQMEENKWADAAMYGPWESIQFMIWGYVTNDPWGEEESLLLKNSNVYPNPGSNTLFIRTALQNACVEVYDINGRLVHSQALTEHETAIDTEDWAEGVYVWKVYTSNGGVSTGSTTAGSWTLVENGKWIKQ